MRFHRSTFVFTIVVSLYIISWILHKYIHYKFKCKMGRWTTETSVLFQNKMCHYYVSDEGSPGKSVAVEGKIKSTGDTLEGCRFSQVVSSAITFSFVYQNRHKDRESLIPTIQVSKDGFDVFFYNCKEDILIGQLFGWSRVSLIFLWAILNYRLFPPQIPSTCSTYQFGYRNSGSSGKGFLNLQEGEFHYGECIHSSSPFREPSSHSERCMPWLYSLLEQEQQKT